MGEWGERERDREEGPDLDEWGSGVRVGGGSRAR